MSTMIAPYAGILRTPRARAFVIAGLIGRLPLSMLGLGALLLVSDATGSYGVAGAVSATIAISGAIVGPQVGRLTDRYGQRRVLLPGLGAHAAAVTALLLTVELDGSRVLLFVVAALVGASFPSLGSLVRARWSALLEDPKMLQTAYAFESILDDVVFTLGPVIVTSLAVTVDPIAGLLVALGLTVVGGLGLAVQRVTEPVPTGQRRGGTTAIRAPGLLALIAAFIAVGTVLGSIDIATVAFARDHDVSELAGVLLGSLALASGIAGAVFGARTWRVSVVRRLQVSTLAMSVCVVPLVFVQSPTWMIAAMALAGCTLTPTIISGFTLVESLVPRAALTEGFTWLGTSLAAGVAAGFVIGGRVVDRFDGHTAFLAAVLGAALAALLVTLGRHRLALSELSLEVTRPAGQGPRHGAVSPETINHTD